MTGSGVFRPLNRMHRQRKARYAARSILAIALVLLLATLAGQVRIARCAGDCADGAAAAACCAGGGHATDAPRCCGCCGPAPHAQLPSRTPAAPGQPAQDAGCRPGCLTTLVLGGIELAPAPTALHAPTAPPVAVTLPPGALADPACEPLSRGRPFDRGPPRPDRETALLATTVLLL